MSRFFIREYIRLRHDGVILMKFIRIFRVILFLLHLIGTTFLGFFMKDAILYSLVFGVILTIGDVVLILLLTIPALMKLHSENSEKTARDAVLSLVFSAYLILSVLNYWTDRMLKLMPV